MPNIAIIGGGMAGLAAATKLTEQGKQVTVFEASPTLGGRARGIDYNGTRLDNGQHILLGACQSTLALLKLVGVTESDALTRLPLGLVVRDLTNGTNFSLNPSPILPAPFHILWGLLFTQGIDMAEKWLAIRFVTWMRLNRFKLKQDQSLALLLFTHRQSATFINNLWEPLCLATLNTPLASASAQVFLNVLRDSFAKKKHNTDVLFAKTDLSDLMSNPIAAYLQQHGSEVKTGTAIKAVIPTTNNYTIQTKAQQYHFEQVVLACGAHQLKNFTTSLPKLSTLANHFTYQPITTVYLQYADSITLSAPMTGVVNSLSQWVFDRGQICGQKGLIATVISAHAPFKQSQKALAEAIAKELNKLFPQLTQPLWHKVITEKRATFSCNVALRRPENTTPYPNLCIAGDYTMGDYPATIEGAIRSGVSAAALI